MTLAPERIESIARAVEDGTASLSDLQSVGLFTDYGGSDLLTITDAAISVAPVGPYNWTLSFVDGTFELWSTYDDHAIPALGECKGSPARAIIAALIRVGEGQRKGKA